MAKKNPIEGDQKLPFVKKDQVILSEGVWKSNSYSIEEIRNAYLNTNWKDKEKRHLYNDHLDVDPKDGAHIPTPVSSWVGFIQNPRFTPKGLIGDVEVWDPTIAFYLDKAKPKFGISATMAGREDPSGEYKDFMFNSFGLVVNPGCKDAYMKLSDEDPNVKKIRMITLADEQESDLQSTERGSNLVKNIMAKELETTDEVETTESNEVKEEAQPEAEPATEEVTEDKTEESEDKPEEKTEEPAVSEEAKVEEEKVETTKPKTEEKSEEIKEDKVDDEKEKEEPKETKKLSEKTVSELTIKELSEYSNFAVKYLSDNPDTAMSDVANAFEASGEVKEESLADMSTQHMFTQMKELMRSLESRMHGKTLSEDTPETEKVEDKPEEKEEPAETKEEPVEEKKELSDTQDVKIKKLSDEINLLQKKLNEPSGRKTLSGTSSNGAIVDHVHEDAFQSMAGFISSGGQGSYTL